MSASPKTDQRRALGLRKFEQQQGKIAASKPKPQKIAEAKQAVEAVSQPSPKPPSPKSAYGRNARWRDKNREQYNESQKALMQRKAKGAAKNEGNI